MENKSAKNPSLLLEIGTEEVPARFLPNAIIDIKAIAAKLFAEHRIDTGEMQAYATPRRIALIVSDVSSTQHDQVKDVFGPAIRAAFDDKGNPTRAATGFAASLGLQVGDLKTKKKGKGDYLVAVIEEKGIETRNVLPDICSKIVLSLRFPKSMRWGHGTLTFVRPIQWILAVYGQEKVSFEIDGIKSGTTTRGHRFLAPAAFQVKDAAAYVSSLENSFVIPEPEKRRQTIVKGISSLFSDPGKKPVLDEELIDMVTYLVEYPVPVLCGFSHEYLKLPKELLLTVMKGHQKYFGVQDGNGDLVNHFVVVSNTKPDNADTVRIGAERVIKARFDDAKFYFHEDRKLRLADRVESLSAVTFHDKLGSLAEKTERITANAAFLSERIAPASRENAVRAALLSKTDLITGVVREFPELQGIMGRYYANNDKEHAEVADAIEEQYLPKSFGDRLPSTGAGAVVSLADRVDNIASFFSIGLVPTGSEDPFALRRQAMGIVSILLDRRAAVSLREIFVHALGSGGTEATLGTIRSFMDQRVEFILSAMGYADDLVASVISQAWEAPLGSLLQRMDALGRFRTDALFPDFLLCIKRVGNIIPKTELPEVDASLLAQDEEKDLHASLETVLAAFGPAVASGDLDAALAALGGIAGPVARFFDNVLVMDKDERVRNNRLALLKRIWAAASRVADFSRLQ
ncbi:MAG: glycine--tRNA ligase subunit beta [Thermodesulfovibrionales bacterium]